MVVHSSRSNFLTAGEETRQCWSCGAMRTSQFCTSCGKVQPPTPADYFSFFGLPRKLNIDVAQLEREFYRLSRKLHPDLYARASAQEREWSLLQSSYLNDAYRTLRDPIARTEYLLSLEGVHFEVQSRAATERARKTGEEKKQVVPPDMLEEVFEFNMLLEEFSMSKQMGELDADALEGLRKAQTNFSAKLSELESDLKGYWREWDAAIESGSPQAERAAIRNKMVDLLNRRSYVRNLVRGVNDAIDS